MEPITRKEMFLAKASGQLVNTPNPITREEMFLQKIAENGGGSGGGGTPNAVQYTAQELTEEQQMQARANLGLYREGKVVLFPETELAYDSSAGGYVIPGFVPVAGETYTVTYNGAEYTLAAFELTHPTYGAVVGIGNTAAVGGNDTGEPFAIGYIVALGAALCIPVDGAENPAVKISKETIHKIPNKYLHMVGGYMGEVVLVDEKDVESGDYLSGFSLEVGGEYEVTWNGTPYACTAKEGVLNGATEDPVSIVYMGNETIAGLGDSGEPFAIYRLNYGDDVDSIFVSNENTPADLKITTTLPVKLPPDFLDLSTVEAALAEMQSAIETAAPLIVAVTGTDTLTADNGAKDVYTAASAGRTVFLDHGDRRASLVFYKKQGFTYKAQFTCVDENTLYTYAFSGSTVTLTETALAAATT